MNFEEALSKLEDIVAKLENGQISLEQSLDLFTEGIKLSKFCTEQLDQAEKKINLLITDAKGEHALTSLDETFFEGGRS